MLVFHANLECLDCWRHGLLWHTKKSLATGFCGVDNPGMNERKKVGRPPVAADKELVHGTLRLTRSQWAKIDMAGLPALRLLIDRWRPKKP